MSFDKDWFIGLLLVVIWLAIDQFSPLLTSTSYDHKWLLLLPAAAAFFVTSRSKEKEVIRALTLLVPISLLGSFFLFAYGELGGKTDFPGVGAMSSTIVLFFWRDL